jgi:hypothetical protein
MSRMTYISLGAGVQSSVMALMAARGLLKPMPDFAVFADTQDEPQGVYKWLDWLEKQLPFPVHRVTYGRLSDSAKRVITSKKSGLDYCKGGIPMFQKRQAKMVTCGCRDRIEGEQDIFLGPVNRNCSDCNGSGEVIDNPGGASGILRRQCTSRFKIEPIQRFVRGLAKKEPSRIPAEQWIGISLDEVIRIKPSRVAFIENRWPLIEEKMTRQDCLKWAKDANLPEPPRSACIFCPYHSDAEWVRLKTDEPEEFQKAVEHERVFRNSWSEQNALKNADVYLHRSCVPLDKVKFDVKAKKDGFGNECEGMCGN